MPGRIVSFLLVIDRRQSLLLTTVVDVFLRGETFFKRREFMVVACMLDVERSLLRWLIVTEKQTKHGQQMVF